MQKFWSNWTDIYLGCMIFIWGGALALFILNTNVLSCDSKLIQIVSYTPTEKTSTTPSNILLYLFGKSGIYIIYSAAIAILYGTNRDRITTQ